MKRSPDERHMEAWLKHFDDQRVFPDPKRVNVCEHTVKTAPRGTVFTVCLVHLLSSDREKTSVTIKTFQSSFHVFTCAIHQEISSFFSKSFLFLYLLLYYLYLSSIINYLYKVLLSLKFRCTILICSLESVHVSQFQLTKCSEWIVRKWSVL